MDARSEPCDRRQHVWFHHHARGLPFGYCRRQRSVRLSKQDALTCPREGAVPFPFNYGVWTCPDFHRRGCVRCYRVPSRSVIPFGLIAGNFSEERNGPVCDPAMVQPRAPFFLYLLALL